MWNEFKAGNSYIRLDTANDGSQGASTSQPIANGSATQNAASTSRSAASGSAPLYRACSKMAPGWLVGRVAVGLAKDIGKAQPQELDKLLTKFEAIKRSDITFGGQQMTEGLEGLASEVYKFIPNDGGVTSEFLRALQIIEKWTTDAKAQKSLGNYSRMVDIANTLLRTRADNASDPTKVAATEEVNKVLKKAFAFINDPVLRGTGKDLDDAKSKLAFTVSAADKIQINITKARSFIKPLELDLPNLHLSMEGKEETKTNPNI